MPYYPILYAPGCRGKTTLCNFPPNNWEVRRYGKKVINLTWSDGAAWVSHSLGYLEKNDVRVVSSDDVQGIVPTGSFPLLSITENPLPGRSDTLPRLVEERSEYPGWRANLGITTKYATTSYQGEIDAFPANGTLLTFGPFIQNPDSSKNYLLLMNIESSPVPRPANVEFYDAKSLTRKHTATILSNQISAVDLDEIAYREDELPLIVCKEMAAIPLYFSRSVDGNFLSLEHTHPPASLVVKGQRWASQKILKNRWFDKVYSQ